MRNDRERIGEIEEDIDLSILSLRSFSFDDLLDSGLSPDDLLEAYVRDCRGVISEFPETAIKYIRDTSRELPPEVRSLSNYSHEIHMLLEDARDVLPRPSDLYCGVHSFLGVF